MATLKFGFGKHIFIARNLKVEMSYILYGSDNEVSMKVLIACEFTGRVREAFAALGHDAWSCDFRPSELPGNHIQGDVLEVLNDGWDLMIAHPPCEKMSYAGLRWFKVQPNRMEEAKAGFEFFMKMVNAPVPKIAVENPRGFPLKWYRQSDQMIHPYYFGDPMTKETHLWLKNLPPLWYARQPDLFGNPQTVCNEYFVNWTKKGKHGHNGKSRSKTFPGIAKAMAAQWGCP